MIIVKSLVVLFNILAAFFYHVDSASPMYCLAHLNMSDCGGHHTQVYHYYKPGSICKLAIWKGCPTENMFNSVHECTTHCIRNKAEKAPVAVNNYRCDIPLDTHVCALQSERVFTYCSEKQSCVEAEWYGCPSANKFNDRETCEDTCYDTEIDWKNKLKRLDMQSIKRVQSVVDELLKTNDIDNENDIEIGRNTFNLDEIHYLHEHNMTLGQILRSGYKKPRKNYVSKNLKAELANNVKNKTMKIEIKQNAVNVSKLHETEKHNLTTL